MTLAIADRVMETTTTTGLGAYTLAGAKAGYQSFGAIGDGNTTFYTATDGTSWETGIGTYTLSGTTLARTSVLASSNSGSAVNWGAGSKDIFVDGPANFGNALVVSDLTNRSIQVANQTSLTSPVGNARGLGAVDLQSRRTASTSVASGLYAVIGGGYRNTASGQSSIVNGGGANIASGTLSVISGGDLHTASAYNTTIGGGHSNTTNQKCATVSGGYKNTASGKYSTVNGGQSNTASGYCASASGYWALASKNGQDARASGRFAALGDAQRSSYTLRKKTLDGTPAELFLDGSSARMVLANNTAWTWFVEITAWRIDSRAAGSAGSWIYSGGIVRVADATTTALIGSNVTVLANPQSTGWSVAITADATNGSLKITVTGAAAQTIQWHCTVVTSETTG